MFAGEDKRQADWKSMAKARLERVLKTPINTNVARNVIMFLGDGMGIATVTAGRIYAAKRKGAHYGEESSLAFDRFPHVGLAKVNHARGVLTAAVHCAFITTVDGTLLPSTAIARRRRR